VDRRCLLTGGVVITGLETGSLGVWCTTDGFDSPSAAAFADQLMTLGYSALWVPETVGRDPFAHIGFLSARQPGLTYATGIANIHQRHPASMAQAALTLAEQSGRFILGLGVSHAPFVEGFRGLEYGKPLQAMTTYLDGIDAAPYIGPPAAAPLPRVLAALGPRMLALAAARTDGALTYWTTPEHTATARQALGPDKSLCVEQKVVLTEDPAIARDTARAAMSVYQGLPNYRNHWLRIGFDAADIDSSADVFLDALVAWGDAETISKRIDEHRAQGADHVCIQPLTPNNPFGVDLAAVEALAPAA
jgi:probable F420-dependent oxidoreductase